MSRAVREKLIEAGAIVPGAAEFVATDTITARVYRHSALPERVVVELVPETLGPAEDLALEFLGFESARPPVPVGAGRRVALGFPAWALINDPENGHHALALVKDIERLARQAKSRPGAAREGFDELARRLGASVPHFLPTFYEQAGRAFMAVENKQSAAIMFGKAREAERVHALPIDEDRQRDVFLEFAFNGALNAKSLTQYAKDLAQRTDPAAAYELFRQVCAERVAGGLPPYAGMAEDLRRLIKAAKLGQAQEEERAIAGLLESPALPHAPLPFWKSYGPALIRLGQKDASIRGRLLGLFPRGGQEGTEEFWFELLRASGALSGLTQIGGVDPAALPPDGASGWLARAAAWRSRGGRAVARSARLLALVPRMEPRLKAENQPLHLLESTPDLDLLDLVLSLGLAVELPEGRAVPMFPLRWWQRDQSPGRRDLVALAAADWARPPLRAGLNEALRPGYRRDAGDRLPLEDVRVFFSTRGTREVLGEWLESAADDVVAGALPSLVDGLDRLRPVAYGKIFGVRPEAHGRIGQADVAAILARTLRIGLMDEFGWPALEAAVAEFPVPKAHPNGWTQEPFSVCEAWPALILFNAVTAVVVGPEGVLLRHTFRLPPDARDHGRLHLDFVEGQLRVIWNGPDGLTGYWSDRPAELFQGIGSMPWRRYDRFGTSLPLPEGGRTAGGRPLLAGDTTLGKARDVVTDGSGWWRLDGESRTWREFDPSTGDGGRRSRPGFFEAGLEVEGAELAEAECVLAPLLPGLEGTPFGAADADGAAGLVGWRSVRLPDGSGEAVSVSGASARLSAELVESAAVGYRPAALGPFRMPGGRPEALLAHGSGGLIAFTDGEVRGSQLSAGRWGQASAYARGTSYVPPVTFWHALRARDEAGSAVLRSITRQQAQALLNSARKGKADKAVRQVLPQITDDRLVLGVSAVVELAVGQVARIEELPRPVSTAVVEVVPLVAADEPSSSEIPDRPSNAAPKVLPEAGVGVPLPSSAADSDLRRALGGLTTGSSGYWGGRSDEKAGAVTGLQGVVTALTGSPGKGFLAKLGLGVKKAIAPSPDPAPRSQVDWTPVIGGLGALALRAGLVVTAPEERAALMVLLAGVAQTPLAEPDGRWRRLRLVSSQPDPAGPGRDGAVPYGTLLRTKGGRAFAQSWTSEWVNGGYRGVLLAVEHVEQPGDFGPVPGYSILGSREGRGWGGAGRVGELLDLLTTRGPAPWRPEAVEELAGATGITRAEAALLLSGLIRIEAYDSNFLPKPVRELLGLKVAEAKTARDALNLRLSADARLELLSLAMPDRPADLWEKGPDVARLAAAWNERFGRRVPVPDQLVADFAAARKGAWSGAREPAAVLQGMVAPQSTSWLTTDLRFRIQDTAVVHDREDEKNADVGFGASHLADAVIGLLWLAYQLPLGDPIRALLPGVYDALQQRLANPHLLLPFREGQAADLDGLRQVYGLPPAQQGVNRPVEVLRLGDAGYLLSRTWSSVVYVHPDRLDGDGEPILRLAEAMPDQTSAPLLLARSPELARLVEELRAEATSAPRSGRLQDPLVSVPDLVAEVARERGLDENAARLYLQVLALPDPTDKNVRLWNGWTPRVLKNATASLLAAGLVVQGKRARAGRTVFLPSAWLPVKAPGLPVEAWKVSMLGLGPDGSSPLHLTVPVTSVRELYRRAWERVKVGDEPRLESLQTGRPGGGSR